MILGISRCPLKSCKIYRGLWGLGGLTPLSLWGVGSYDQHQCGQSTFGARGWGLHVGRNSGCLNRIPAWTSENVSFFMHQKKNRRKKNPQNTHQKQVCSIVTPSKKTSCWLSIMNCHLQKKPVFRLKYVSFINTFLWVNFPPVFFWGEKNGSKSSLSVSDRTDRGSLGFGIHHLAPLGRHRGALMERCFGNEIHGWGGAQVGSLQVPGLVVLVFFFLKGKSEWLKT